MMDKAQFKSRWFNQFKCEIGNTKVLKDNSDKFLSAEQKYSMLHEALTDAFNFYKMQMKYNGVEEETDEEEYL